MAVIRLDPNTPRAWALWPILEDRMRVFCKEYAPDTPPDALIQHCRRLFVETPTVLGAWALMTDEGEMIGHLVGWVDLYWGQPYLIVHQAHIDRGHALGVERGVMEAALDDWAWSVNALYEAADSPLRVTTVRLMTEWPEAWIRYFHKKAQRQLTVVSFPVGISTGR
ncbi:MAG: hypothetical protein Q8R28_15690 [Dehalococcoidia bacterium]|nr:hypothetical protein [Dehalococcoidia bacterium]